jgi:hypothetical protein
MTIDMSISIGHIITIISFLIGVITWGSTIRASVTGLDNRMQEVEAEIKKLTEIYIATNNMNYKLGDFERRITALETRLASIEARAAFGLVKSS